MADTDKEKVKHLSPLTLGLIIGSMVVIMVVALGVLYPQYRRIDRLEAERVEKKIRLEEQKKIFPIYKLADRLANKNFDPELPFPDRKPISRDHISGLTGVFNEIAAASGMTLAENSLDFGGFDQASNMISLDVMFKGSLFGFRNCLIDLAALPYFKGIEDINITTDRNNVRQCKARIQIAIENPTPNRNKTS